MGDFHTCLEVRRPRCKNRSMICKSSLQNIRPRLLTEHPSPMRTLCYLDSMSPQTSSLEFFYPINGLLRFSSFYWQQILWFTSFSTSMWSVSSLWQRIKKIHLWLTWNIHGPYYTSNWSTSHKQTFIQHFLVWISPTENHSNSPGENHYH